MSKLRILVVDDYQEHTDALVEYFNKFEAYEARGAMTPAQAFEICKEWHPQLLIYDGLMEGVRAWQFAMYLLRMDVPRPAFMVALTGFASVVQRRLCEECGYDVYTTKPIEMSLLHQFCGTAQMRLNAAQKTQTEKPES